MPVSYSGTAITWPDNSTTTSGWTGFKNRIINGAQVIDQRNAGAAVAAPTDNYITDRWTVREVGGGVASAQQSSTAPAGFTKSLLLTVTTADASIASTDRYVLAQFIEGYNVADLGWGTADAATVTLSFRVRSSVTGTYGGALKNENVDRAYPFTYTISAANTWETKSVTIPGDTTGTWNTTNGTGISVRFGLGVGSTFSSTANTWQAGDFISVTGATNWISTLGATFYITGVQFERGSTASSFDYRPYGTELALCQRYFEKNVNTDVKPQNGIDAGANGTFAGGGLTCYNSTSARTSTIVFQVSKRAAPTLTFYRSTLGSTDGQWQYYNSSTWSSSTAIGAVDGGQNTNSFSAALTGSSLPTNGSLLYCGVWTASAEL